jgi:hypothetical protein
MMGKKNLLVRFIAIIILNNVLIESSICPVTFPPQLDSSNPSLFLVFHHMKIISSPSLYCTNFPAHNISHSLNCGSSGEICNYYLPWEPSYGNFTEYKCNVTNGQTTVELCRLVGLLHKYKECLDDSCEDIIYTSASSDSVHSWLIVGCLVFFSGIFGFGR